MFCHWSIMKTFFTVCEPSGPPYSNNISGPTRKYFFCNMIESDIPSKYKYGSVWIEIKMEKRRYTHNGQKYTHASIKQMFISSWYSYINFVEVRIISQKRRETWKKQPAVHVKSLLISLNQCVCVWVRGLNAYSHRAHTPPGALTSSLGPPLTDICVCVCAGRFVMLLLFHVHCSLRCIGRCVCICARQRESGHLIQNIWGRCTV